MKRYFILCLLFLMAINVHGGEKDSLTGTLTNRQHDTTRINVLNRLASLIAEDDTTVALKYTNEAIINARKAGYQKGIVMGYYNLAFIKEINFDYPSAGAYYQKGIALARKAHFQGLIAYGCQDYALTLKKQSLHKQSLQYNDSALTIYTSLGDSAKMATLYTNIGNNYKNLNLFEKAISFHLKALDYASAHNNYKAKARAYNNIGLVYERNGNQEMALQSYLNMVAPATESGDKKTLVVCYGNIGAAYQNLGKHEKALHYLLKAKELSEVAGLRKELLMNLTNLASTQNSLGKYKETLATSKQAMQLSKDIDDAESGGYALLTTGVAQRELKDNGNAERSLKDALQIAEDLKCAPLQMLAEEEITRLYYATGRYEYAFNHLQQLSILKDTMYSTERHEQLITLQTQYEAEQKDREIAEKTAAITQGQLLIEKKNKLLTVSFLSAAALVVVIGLVVRNFRLKKKHLQQEALLIQSQAMARLQEEKLRISRELHDNIGSQLTFINTSLQSLQRSSEEDPLLKETQTLTLNTIRELRNTVWLINKQDFTLDEFIVKLHDYTRTVQRNGLTLQLEVTGDTNVKLKSIIAAHLFRTIQEAINNTLKHANASLLTISLHSDANAALSLVIADNGNGFDTNVYNGGNGLQNLNARVAELNGQLTIKSAAGEGTFIRIEVPLT